MNLTFGNKLTSALNNKIQGQQPLSPLKSSIPAKNASNPFLNVPSKSTPNPYTPQSSWQQTLNTNAPTAQPQGVKTLPSTYSTPGGMSTVKPTTGAVTTPKPQVTASIKSPVSAPVSTIQPIQQVQSITSSAPFTAPTPETPSVYKSTVDKMSNQGGSPYNVSAQDSIGGLKGIAREQTPEVLKARKDYNDFAQSSPYMIAAQHNPNVAADVASGRSSLLGQTFAAILGAKAQDVNNALLGQGQQITAGTNAASNALQGQGTAQSALNEVIDSTQPVANAPYFGSPENGNVVGSGSEGSGNTLINNAVHNAVQQIKNGSSTQDAMATLSQFGPIGQQALIKEMQKYDPNWSITASNAIAQQNMTQGQQYQGEATQLSTTLKQLDTLTPVVTQFITKSGLNNQENPFFNKAIKDYASQLKNPADVASLNAMMADVKTYTAQILGASGLNPTEVSATVNSFDPSLLNATQLTSFLANLRNLGQIRLQPIQETASASYGSGKPVMGGMATPTTNSNYAPQNSPSMLNTDNPVIQGLIGQGMAAPTLVEGLLGGMARGITGLASKIFK